MTHYDVRRGDDETELQFVWRLCSAKDSGLIDCTWFELADVINRELFSDERDYISECVYRKNYHCAKNYYEQVFSKMQSEEYSDDIVSKQRELKKEKQKFYDERTAYNKLIRDRSRQEELNEIVERTILEGCLPSLAPRKEDRKQVYGSDNDLIVSLNDIHYGAVVDNYWNKFDSDICAQMFSDYLDRIIKIAETHNSENCYVTCNGDMISGNIHNSIAITNKENVVQQVMGVSELISCFVAELSKYFKNVYVASVAGNHSRIDVKDRALKDERLDDLVEWYLKARLADIENVTVGAGGAFGTKVDSTMYLIDVRGKTYCGVHGDYDGTPSKIQSLQTMAGRPIYAVLLGHLHHCKTDEVQGVKTVMAGSFIGMDEYCIQKRIVGHPEQMVCVCDEDGIRCSYCVKL